MREEILLKFDINKIPQSIKGKVKPPANYVAIYDTASISYFISDSLWQRSEIYWEDRVSSIVTFGNIPRRFKILIK